MVTLNIDAIKNYFDDLMANQEFVEALSSLKEKFMIYNFSPLCYLRPDDRQLLPEELRKAFDDLVQYICREKAGAWKPHVQLQLSEFLNLEIDVDENKETKFYLHDIAIIKKKNIVYEHFSDILKKVDKDGLIKIDDKCRIVRDGFSYDSGYLIFSEWLSNNLYLTTWFRENWKGQFELRLGFDEDVIGIPETVRHSEYAYKYWGPDNIKIKEAKRLNDYAEYFTPINGITEIKDHTQFCFYKDGDKYAVHVEEVFPLSDLQQEFEYKLYKRFRWAKEPYFSKYLHAYLDADFNKCFHIDGAIKVWDSLEEWKLRMDQKLHESQKVERGKKIKLFRIDSEEGCDLFEEMLMLFFVHNPHIDEFLQGVEGDESQQNKKRGEKAAEFLNRTGWLKVR